MKIVHIAPNAPYTENWGYQENLLPKYQQKDGNSVSLIITNTMHQDGQIVETNCRDYLTSDGVRVVRLKKKIYKSRILTNLTSRLEVLDLLKEIQPDFIFFHGLISTTIYDVVKYKKRVNPNCKIVCDNHLDYNIGMGSMNFKKRIIRSFYRFHNKRTVKYVEKVYGVTPWRKTYAEDFFKVPSNKTDVLIMGADDEKIDFKNKEMIRQKIRAEYGIEDNDFFIVTGGKIDEKKNILELMTACQDLQNVKLLVFGSLHNDVKEKFESLIGDNIIYIGWINAEKVYDYFFAADLVMFPGTHSVLWEQACASKVPCVFKKWEGMQHVNNGGNSDFLETVSVESVKEKIEELKFTEKYYEMKKIAESEKTDIYLYSNIAKKSIEVCNE